MKRRVAFLLILAVLVITAELRCTPKLGGQWAGIPFQTMGGPAAWTVDVATGARGRDGWWTYRLYGEGGEQLATVNAAIDAQAWLEFKTTIPRLDWWLRFGIVGAIEDIAPEG